MGRSRTAAAGILQLRLLILACSVLILLPILSMAMADNSSSCRTSWPANPCGPSSFSFYLHNMVYNPAVDNKNSFDSVYGLPLNVSWPNPLFFGLTSTFEDPLTIGPSNSSQQIGIAQGIWQYDSKVDFTLFHLFTANITDGDHKGTIDIFGQVRETDPVRYLSVIGGTGDFLGARGLASCRLIMLDHTPPAKWTLSFDLDLYY